MKNTTVKASGKEFDVEVADSLWKKFKGMRLRSKGSMLFTFPGGSRARIDMFLVPERLQLIFLDEDRKVLEIQEAEPWSLNPGTWQFYRPEKEYSYLLESFDFLEIQEGENLNFEI